MCYRKDSMGYDIYFENLEEITNYKQIEERPASLKDVKYGLSANYYSFPEECEN